MSMSWGQFTSIPNGTRVLNHGWDQCVALANLYHESVIGGSFVPVGSAFQWWTQFGGFATLTNNYVQSSTPVAGAIFVARYGIYDAPNGHIGVVTSVNSNGTFNTMEQNAGTWRYVGRYTRGMANVLGFLIPRNNPATPQAPEVPEALPKKRKKKKMDYATVCVVNGRKNNGQTSFNAMVFCLGNGEVHEFEAFAPYIDNIAKTYQTGPKSIITASHYNKIKRELADTRRRLDARK